MNYIKSVITIKNNPANIDKRKFSAVIYTVLVLISISFLNAQVRHFTLKNTQMIEIKSDLTGRDHELIIFLPDSYDKSPDKYYPVLYYVDAYWDTPLLNSIHGQLVYDNVIPELIMVGFSYPGENPNYGDLRARDLTPTKVVDENPNSGDADKFLQFIETVVIPKIESNYRVKKDDRALSGNSLGGLFTLYAMYKKQNLFKRFISISPAAGWDNNFLFKLDETYSGKYDTMPVRLFLSYGSDEYLPFRQPIIDFQKKLANHNYKDFGLLNYKIEGERHSGVKSEGYSRGLRWVYKDIAPKGPSGLEKEYKN